MGVLSSSVAGQVPASDGDRQRRIHLAPILPSRNPSNASSITGNMDNGLNQRALTTQMGCDPAQVAPQPTRILRKKLPWLDGPLQSKLAAEDLHVPGSFESKAPSLEIADMTSGDTVALSGFVGPAPQPKGNAAEKRASVRSLGDDLALRAVGSTPSLRQGKGTVRKTRTLSLSSEPTPGMKPASTKAHVHRALGGMSRKMAATDDYSPSEYSTTISSDLPPWDTDPAPVSPPRKTAARKYVPWKASEVTPWEDSRPIASPGNITTATEKTYSSRSCTSCDSPSLGPTETTARLPGAAADRNTSMHATIPKKPLVVPKPSVPYSKSRERGESIPDLVIKRGTTSPKPQPRGKQIQIEPIAKLHELPSHLQTSSSSPSSKGAVEAPPPLVIRPTRLRRQDRSLGRAVTGMEDLMEDALHVAQDAADKGRADDVAHVLDSAAAALRKASAAIPRQHVRHHHRKRTSPFEASPRDSASSSESASEHGVTHSAFSSALHSRDISAETAPTLLTSSSVQPLFIDPYTGKQGNPPASQRGSMMNHGTGSCDDYDYDHSSIAPTPPRLYQPASAESIVRDFAYTRTQHARAQGAGPLGAPAGYGAAADFYGDHGETIGTQPGLRRSIVAPQAKSRGRDKDLPLLPGAAVTRGFRKDGLRELEHVPTETEPP
ncbi:hypothetical protein LTR53_016370, partial [Teratosphaeriaceae sp. CCFEE 6253]